jgi:hypothetical protein
MHRTVSCLLLIMGCTEIEQNQRSNNDQVLEELSVAETYSSSGLAACVTTSVEVLYDLDMAADGFDFAPGPLVDEMVGAFAGLVGTALGDIEGSIDISSELGEVRAIDNAWNGEGEELPCGQFYEVAFSASLAAEDGLLDETFSALLQARSLEDARFGVLIPTEEVRGMLRPEALDEASYETTALAVTGAYTDGVWAGSLSWQAWDNDRYESRFEEDAGAYVFEATED